MPEPKPPPKEEPPKKGPNKKNAPRKRPPEQDLEIGDDFLDDLEADLDDVVSAPTEEFPAPKAPSQEELPDKQLEGGEPGENDSREEQPTAVVAAAATPDKPDADGPPASKPGSQFGPPRNRFPLWARFLAASFLIVASIATATAASLILYLSDIAGALAHNGSLIGVQQQLAQVQGGAPETIMVIGSDHRAGQGGGRPGLSDTAILVRLDPNRNAIALWSIPRDLQVNIPGHGPGKFNSAYAYGGPQLTLRVTKALTGLTVNHLVQVDFRGFAEAVSAIGCVYADVDRGYHHNASGSITDYSSINLNPGYQRLCGPDALQYVRYRHTDNDIVRNARQQDFMREARQRVPATDLLTKRHDLIKIFTTYTTSDINSASAMLDVIKLFIAARNEPVKEIHFPGTLGPSYVYATRGQIEQAVSQFLGIEGTNGPRGQSAAQSQNGVPLPAQARKPAKGGKKKAAKPAAIGSGGGSGVTVSKQGRAYALVIHRRNPGMPIYYPSTIAAGSQFAQFPRIYSLADPALQDSERFSYRFVLQTPTGDFYGLQGLTWKNAPILNEAHQTKTIGNRTYNLYFDNDRLRMVSWSTDQGVYWVSNSLLQSLSASQMLAIARGAQVIAPGR